MYEKSLKKYKNINRKICSICLDPIDIDSSNQSFSGSRLCKHIFHDHCIRKLVYLYKDTKCPLCRRKTDYITDLNKKQRRKLKNQMIDHYTNEYGRMAISEFVQLHKFIDENCHYHPDWMEKLFAPVYSCLRDMNHLNIYAHGYINILRCAARRHVETEMKVYMSGIPFENEFVIKMNQQKIPYFA